ncbi:MAG: two-component system, OmpR family, phosphate regulon sensor histidine kinase PhoR [Parcubacteria bacterium C7867-005]|nr:MAG: two-component system, OmpR family, phosphate regulon sensor histidine kinase PhoR [Parcubacteria bacterium C7867-005]
MTINSPQNKSFFGIQWKLAPFYISLTFFVICIVGTQIFELNRIRSSADNITKTNVPVVRSLQESLSAAVEGQTALESVLDIDDPKKIPDVSGYVRVFSESTDRFNMFMAALMWGSETDAFKNSSGGKNYDQWIKLGLRDELVVDGVMKGDSQITGEINLYYTGFVNNAEDAIKHRLNFLNLKKENRNIASEQEKQKSKISIDKAREFTELANIKMRELISRTNDSIEKSTRALDETEQEARRRLVLISVIGSIFFSLGTILSVRQFILNPLYKLVSAVEEFGKGKLDTVTHINTNDELETLANAFNGMVKSISQYTIGLEAKIKDRTQELDKKLVDLEETKKAMINLLEDDKILEEKLAVQMKNVEQQVVERTKELNEEKARLLASINSLSLGFIIANVDDTIFLKNHALVDLLGINEDKELTVGDVSKMMGESFDLKDQVKKCLEGERVCEINEIFFNKKSLRAIIAPILLADESKNKIGYVILLEDITERKVTERSREEFFAVASHELRTPLTAIRGNADMMLDYWAKLDEEKKKNMIHNIHTASKSLIGIVNDFLDMSRLEQGKIVFDSKPIDLVRMINQVVQETEQLTKNKKLSLEFKLSDKAVPEAFADVERTRQIINNLLGNAINYTEKGGITISLQAREGFADVIIEDTGKGVSKENQSLLFRKFQQAGEKILTRDSSKGTGLGLYISKLLAEEMGGTIELVKSDLGEGSTFRLSLPVVVA